MISFLIVNYNTLSFSLTVCEALKTVMEENGYQVVLVDNASPNTVSKKDIPDWVHFVPCAKNDGFAAGVNSGVGHCKHPYVFLLNPDLILNQTVFIDKCLRLLLSQENIAAVSPLIVYENDHIQFGGYTPINPLTGRNSSPAFGKALAYRKELKSGITASAHGAAMLFKKSAWEAVGGFPEGYFLYYEEFDFCLQLQKKGYLLWFEPKAMVYHKGSLAMDISHTPKHFYLQRNRMWLMKRHFPLLNNLLAQPYMLFAASFKYLVSFGRDERLKQMWHGALEGFFKSYPNK